MKTRAIRDVPGESVPPNGTDFFERRGEEAAAEGVPVANSTSETALRPGTRGAAGGYVQRPMERGRNCVERNRQRAGAGRVAERNPPASQGHREGKRFRAWARSVAIIKSSSGCCRFFCDCGGKCRIDENLP